jgi:GNAT superfamily N-acetyltransferase
MACKVSNRYDVVNSFLQVHQASRLEQYRDNPLYANFDLKLIHKQQPDLHLVLLDGGSYPVARCSLWWRSVPPVASESPGIIGHFAAKDEAAAKMLLARAVSELGIRGCTLAIGPMDGNTWRRYRFVTESGQEPSFFLEPENPPEYPAWFQEAGFAPISHYSSGLTTDLLLNDSRIPRALDRLVGSGIALRHLDITRFQDELRSIYRLSTASFVNNYLYTPLAENEFIAQYTALSAYVKPELTLIAERDGSMVGYLFGIPDLNQMRRGDVVDTFIIKTVAVEAGKRNAGLGSVLVAQSQRVAYQQGYRRAIHALMHNSNSSRNISGHYARPMRRYALFQKRLNLKQ